MQFFTFLGVKNRKNINFYYPNHTYKEYECQQDASFEPLMALIGPTGRPVAMRMGPKKRKKIDA